MNTAATATRHEIDVEDVEYLRHGNKALLARVYKPRGAGPFPLVIDLHGGAWTKKDRFSDVATCEALAKGGIVAVALDFRMPPEAKYPGSLQDVNYAVRWCKTNAKDLKTRADLISILGVSSGGQQAMLTAMRPNDPRYASIPGKAGVDASFDASVRSVILCWPVIDPLGRYHYAKQKRDAGDAKQANEWIKAHDEYWAGEAEMAEGNPTMALERGEKTPLPPVIYLQGTADPAHPRPNLDRFVAAYRKAGGEITLRKFEGEPHTFIVLNPTSAASVEAIGLIVDFVRER